MLLLILLAIYISGIATVGLVFLIRQVQTGVIRSKHGHRIYRSQEPDQVWFSIALMLVCIVLTFPAMTFTRKSGQLI